MKRTLKANIEIKPNAEGDRWRVEACSANIDNELLHPMPSGEIFRTKDWRLLKLSVELWSGLRKRDALKQKMPLTGEYPNYSTAFPSGANA